MKEQLQRVEDQIDQAYKHLDNLYRLKTFIEQNEELLSTLPAISVYCNTVDFDNLTHDGVMEVMKAFSAGKWEKTPSDDKINYSTTIDGVTIRCWKGDPPPNCRVEWEEVEVPARTEKRAKIVCT